MNRVAIAFSILSTVLVALSFPAQAQLVCYDTVQGPDVLSCSGNRPEGSSSADFTGACNWVRGPDVVVEVACPGRWVNVANTSLTHEQACAAAGLSPTAISGQICASGERRPTVGSNPGSINYRYGTWGGVSGGGTFTTSYTFEWGNNNESCFDCSTYTYTYCWTSGQKRDNDSTDLVVAYACE